jgi:hypothetical protein
MLLVKLGVVFLMVATILWFLWKDVIFSGAGKAKLQGGAVKKTGKGSGVKKVSYVTETPFGGDNEAPEKNGGNDGGLSYLEDAEDFDRAIGNK